MTKYANFIVAVNLDGRDEGYYACPEDWVKFDAELGEANFYSDAGEAPEGTDDELVNGIPDDWIYLDHDHDDAYRILALMISTGEWDLASMAVVSDDRRTVTVGRREWIVATDGEADDLWDEELQNVLDEVVLPGVPDQHRRYFDEAQWKEDAKVDGRAHSLARYDGHEDCVETGVGDYYVYRQN